MTDSSIAFQFHRLNQEASSVHGGLPRSVIINELVIHQSPLTRVVFVVTYYYYQLLLLLSSKQQSPIILIIIVRCYSRPLASTPVVFRPQTNCTNCLGPSNWAPAPRSTDSSQCSRQTVSQLEIAAESVKHSQVNWPQPAGENLCNSVTISYSTVTIWCTPERTTSERVG